MYCVSEPITDALAASWQVVQDSSVVLPPIARREMGDRPKGPMVGRPRAETRVTTQADLNIGYLVNTIRIPMWE